MKNWKKVLNPKRDDNGFRIPERQGRQWDSQSKWIMTTIARESCGRAGAQISYVKNR
jgi:hypothetical protein